MKLRGLRNSPINFKPARKTSLSYISLNICAVWEQASNAKFQADNNNLIQEKVSLMNESMETSWEEAETETEIESESESELGLGLEIELERESESERQRSNKWYEWTSRHSTGCKPIKAI